MESTEQLAERYSLKEQALWAAEQGMKERENALHRGELAVVQVLYTILDAVSFTIML